MSETTPSSMGATRGPFHYFHDPEALSPNYVVQNDEGEQLCEAEGHAGHGWSENAQLIVAAVNAYDEGQAAIAAVAALRLAIEDAEDYLCTVADDHGHLGVPLKTLRDILATLDEGEA